MNDDLSCTCKFVAKGEPMNTTGCKIHPNLSYACTYTGQALVPTGTVGVKCTCPSYSPSCGESQFNEMRSLGLWPRCICGHIAQEH